MSSSISATASPWADLPTDMVDSVVCYLDIFDAFRLTAVCKSWAKAIASSPLLPFGKPCLLMTYQEPFEKDFIEPVHALEDEDCMFHLHDLCDQKLPSLAIMGALKGQRWVGANGGWLATADLDWRFEAQLVNPCTGVTIYLPCVSTIPGIKYECCNWYVGTIRRIVLCEPPPPDASDDDDNMDYLAIAQINTFPGELLAVTRGRDHSWKVFEKREDRCTFEDIVVHKGKIFAVEKCGDVYAWDLCAVVEDEAPKPERVQRPQEISDGEFIVGQYHLAETADGRRLLLACTYGGFYPYWYRGDYYEVKFRREGMVFYELDVDDPACSAGGEGWHRVTRLGSDNRALFLGTNYPFWANVPKATRESMKGFVRPNCVCVAPLVHTEAYWDDHNNPDDAAVYDLEHHIYRPIGIFFGDKLHTYQVPIWYEPTLKGATKRADSSYLNT